MWTDAARTTPAGNTALLYTWDDKSGNNRHAVQSTSGARPNRNDASAGPGLARTSVNFPNGCTMVTGAWSLAHDLCAFVVAKSTSSTYTIAVYMLAGGGATNNQGPGMAFYPDNQTFLCYTNPGASYNTLHNTTQGSYHVYTGVFATTVGVSQTGVDDVEAQFDCGQCTGTAGVRLGAVDDATAGYLVGNLCEVIIYNAIISRAKRSGVAAMLKAKWGTP